MFVVRAIALAASRFADAGAANKWHASSAGGLPDFPSHRFLTFIYVAAMPPQHLKRWWVRAPYPRLRCLVIHCIKDGQPRTGDEGQAIKCVPKSVRRRASLERWRWPGEQAALRLADHLRKLRE